jgi:hypothetical protein
VAHVWQHNRPATTFKDVVSIIRVVGMLLAFKREAQCRHFATTCAPISGEITVKEHIILGIDERERRATDLWLSENPAIKSPARASATKRTAMLVDAARE